MVCPCGRVLKSWCVPPVGAGCVLGGGPSWDGPAGTRPFPTPRGHTLPWRCGWASVNQNRNVCGYRSKVVGHGVSPRFTPIGCSGVSPPVSCVAQVVVCPSGGGPAGTHPVSVPGGHSMSRRCGCASVTHNGNVCGNRSQVVGRGVSPRIVVSPCGRVAPFVNHANPLQWCVPRISPRGHTLRWRCGWASVNQNCNVCGYRSEVVGRGVSPRFVVCPRGLWCVPAAVG